MLRHPYDTPTFKTNALRLVSNKGWLKHILQLYKWLRSLLIFCFSSAPACIFATASISPLFTDLAIICVNCSSYIAMKQILLINSVFDMAVLTQ